MSATSSRQATRPPLPLHRVRFFDHTPSPITALAYAPTPLPAALDPSAKGKGKQEQPTIGVARGTGLDGQPELGVLILARENGDVEIWEWTAPEGDGQGNWVLEKVCRIPSADLGCHHNRTGRVGARGRLGLMDRSCRLH